jgi:alpha-methylacyl-CoA racemase
MTSSPAVEGQSVLPLAGITVLDFSTLLPGPLATLMLAEAGARVLKVERPGGEDMRAFAPAHGASSAPFMALNGGKIPVVLDLKEPAGLARARALVMEADVLVEQFRPGVMARLGLGYDRLRVLNPRLIYCAISGFGQHGPRAALAGHDISYQALSGLLASSVSRGAAPPRPPALVADIAGGAYPAVMNILLALRQRDLTGQGSFLDIDMAAGCRSFGWLSEVQAVSGSAGAVDAPHLLTGASPRYGLYATADGWFVAVGAIEDKFWAAFCRAVGLAAPWSEPEAEATAVKAAVAAIIVRHDASYWRDVLEPLDCCCAVVRTASEALSDDVAPHYRVTDSTGAEVPMATIPIAPAFRADPAEARTAPHLERPVASDPAA